MGTQDETMEIMDGGGGTNIEDSMAMVLCISTFQFLSLLFISLRELPLLLFLIWYWLFPYSLLGHGTVACTQAMEASKPPPGPKMPDGTRGFAAGRGRPLRSDRS